MPERRRVQVAPDSDARVRPQVGAHHDVYLQRPDEVAAEIRSLLT